LNSNKLIPLLLYFSFLVFLQGDDVELKNGKTYSNVKTNLQKDKLKITFEDGKSIQVPISSIKKIKPQEVKWNPKIETDTDTNVKTIETKEIETKSEDNTDLPITNDSKKNTNEDFVLESFIPFWSGLNRTNLWYLGISLSALELYTFYNFTQFPRQPKEPIPDFAFLFYLNEIQRDRGIRPEERQDIRTYLFLNYYNNNHTILPSGEIVSNEHYLLERRQAFRGFLFAILLDVGITYLFSGKDPLATSNSNRNFYFSISPNLSTKSHGFDFGFHFYY